MRFVAFLFTLLIATSANAQVGIFDQNRDRLCPVVTRIALFGTVYSQIEQDQRLAMFIPHAGERNYLVEAVQQFIDIMTDISGPMQDEELKENLVHASLSCAADLIEKGTQKESSLDNWLGDSNQPVFDNPPPVTYNEVKREEPPKQFVLKSRALQWAMKYQCRTDLQPIYNDGKEEIYRTKDMHSNKPCTITCTRNTSQCTLSK